MIPNEISSAVKGLRFFRLMPKEDQPEFLRIISDWYKQPTRVEDLTKRLKRAGFDQALANQVGSIVHKQQAPRALASVSPRFRRAVEAEVRRMMEIKFGQGGDLGMIQRSLDQRMGKLVDLYERMDGEISQLLFDYKSLKKGKGALSPSKGDLTRIDGIIRDLEQATKLNDQLGSRLG